MVDKREYMASELSLRILKRNNIRHIVVLEKTDVTSEKPYSISSVKAI